MVVQELIAKLGFDVDQVGLGRADKGIESLAAGALKAVGAMYLAKQAFDAIVGGISGSIAAASAKEDTTTQFKVMLGDLEAAKYLYQEINKYANITSYSTAGAAQSVQMMMSSLSAKDALSNMKMIGDIALGDNERMQGIARAVSQVAAKKKLQGDELMQLRERMFDPLVYLAEMRGVSQQELEAQVQKGKLGIKDLTAAMEYATSKGQKFYKGAEEGGKTWSGLLSTLKDNITMIGVSIGEKLIPALKEILKAIAAIWTKFEGTGRMIGEMFAAVMTEGSSAIDIALLLADAFHLVGIAIGGALILWEQFMLDIDLAKIAVFSLAGLFRDWYDFIGLGIAKIFSKVFKFLGWAGDKLGIESLSGFKKNAATVDENIEDYSPGRFTKAYTADAAKDAKSRGDAILRLWELMGDRQPGEAKLSLTDRLEAIMSKQAGKQPITNITQNNNLTVNAEDPIKTMSESASAKFFQGAFIQIRHATT